MFYLLVLIDKGELLTVSSLKCGWRQSRESHVAYFYALPRGLFAGQGAADTHQGSGRREATVVPAGDVLPLPSVISFLIFYL